MAVPDSLTSRARLAVAASCAGFALLAVAAPTAHANGGGDDLTQRDIVSIVILWIHGLASLGWILGVVVMALALSARPGVLAEGVRTKLREEYVAWGAWVHWSLVLWVVLTGVYNMLVVTPFTLVWRPSELGSLDDIPYGALYEGILLVKLLLFVALLITGTQLLRRTVGASGHVPAARSTHQGFVRVTSDALGPAGIAYVAIVPLILGAAVALRYVHILSHAASPSAS